MRNALAELRDDFSALAGYTIQTIQLDGFSASEPQLRENAEYNENLSTNHRPLIYNKLRSHRE
jgi:hypothetical protein